ncbi:MAG: iron-containing alcohol dehydrogenase [Burkholderiales bacterium]|jgi:glycerol-1-phosphate dehydrogenase [NAD(P)+]|nr:iron-containing alcohol dehydrogenase [Burkholderiales bacterium]
MSDRLAQLLDGRLADPDGSGRLSVPVRRVEIGRGLAAQAAALLAPLDLGPRPAVVHDPGTRAAMGDAVLAALRGAGVDARDVGLEPDPQPDADAVADVIARTAGATGLVAVGSGTIDDIVKYAAHTSARPWAVFGTAPSMNGYTSVSAAITVNGHKKSLPATAARGVFLDLDVLARAPRRMIAAGLGDSICRPTAQADWWLSHRLLDTPFRHAPFVLLADDEPALLQHAAGLLTGDLGAIERLARTLVLSGLGMSVCGGSWPASQAEHLVSHLLEMRPDPAWPSTLHGEHIAVTTLTIARLQAAFVAQSSSPRFDPPDVTRAQFHARFGPALGAQCWDASAAKRFDAVEVARIDARLAAQWPDLRAELAAMALPLSTLDAALAAVDAPRTPEALGIDAADYAAAVRDARLIRDRFTILDVVADRSGAW